MKSKQLHFNTISYRHFILVIFLLFVINHIGYSQDDEIYDNEILDTQNTKIENPKDRKTIKKKELNLENVFVGSGAGLDFWNTTFSFSISPHIGYRIGNIIAPAVGLTYLYIHDFQRQTNTHVYGPKALLRIRPLKDLLGNVYLHGEVEYLTLEETNPYFNPNIPNGQPRYYQANQTRLNAGFGYTNNFETGVGFTTEFLFDFNYLKNPRNYFNPFTYRLGFYYGF